MQQESCHLGWKNNDEFGCQMRDLQKTCGIYPRNKGNNIQKPAF